MSVTPLHVSDAFTGLSATDAWHRAESVMQHIQHLSFESLVKMDHLQKELNATSQLITGPTPSRDNT